MASCYVKLAVMTACPEFDRLLSLEVGSLTQHDRKDLPRSSLNTSGHGDGGLEALLNRCLLDLTGSCSHELPFQGPGQVVIRSRKSSSKKSKAEEGAMDGQDE